MTTWPYAKSETLPGQHRAGRARCNQEGTEGTKLTKYVRAHLFKILYWGLIQDKSLCDRLAAAYTLPEIPKARLH